MQVLVVTGLPGSGKDALVDQLVAFAPAGVTWHLLQHSHEPAALPSRLRAVMEEARGSAGQTRVLYVTQGYERTAMVVELLRAAMGQCKDTPFELQAVVTVAQADNVFVGSSLTLLVPGFAQQVCYSVVTLFFGSLVTLFFFSVCLTCYTVVTLLVQIVPGYCDLVVLRCIGLAAGQALTQACKSAITRASPGVEVLAVHSSVKANVQSLMNLSSFGGGLQTEARARHMAPKEREAGADSMRFNLSVSLSRAALEDMLRFVFDPALATVQGVTRCCVVLLCCFIVVSQLSHCCYAQVML
jgi:hypothetical protein